MTWSAKFKEPIHTPDGRVLKTAGAARNWVLTLPPARVKTHAWEVALENLLAAGTAPDDRLADFARMSLSQAIRDAPSNRLRKMI